MNKKGQFVDIFVYVIATFIIVIFSVMMMYMGGLTEDKLKESFAEQSAGLPNPNATLDNTIGKVNQAYQMLPFITVFLFIGMAISIFFGYFFVKTHPAFFVFYWFMIIIAVLISVPISNTYEQLTQDPTLGSTFLSFRGATYIYSILPLWVSVVGLIGAAILFTNLRRGEEEEVF